MNCQVVPFLIWTIISTFISAYAIKNSIGGLRENKPRCRKEDVYRLGTLPGRQKTEDERQENNGKLRKNFGQIALDQILHHSNQNLHLKSGR